MIISCLECNNQISDKALYCPHCGFPNPQPNNSTNKPQKVRRKANTKFGRLPNGFGSIVKLSGSRRNPFMVYAPVKEYDLDGNPKRGKPLGYYPTYKAAYEVLLKHNQNGIGDIGRTFGEVYEEYMEEEGKRLSRNTLLVYRSNFTKHLGGIAGVPIVNLSTANLQGAVDENKCGFSSSKITIIIIHRVYKFALQHDYITIDKSQGIETKQLNNTQKGIPFKETDLRKFWAHRSDPRYIPILIMIYTGMRISELEGYTYDGKYIIGGIKSKAGRDRVIPIIPDLRPLVDSFTPSDFNQKRYRYTWDNLMRKCGCFDVNGIKHTPHDCRHTFSWLADKYSVDDLSKHLIMGHSLGKDIERNVYGHRTQGELMVEMKKIKIIS